MFSSPVQLSSQFDNDTARKEKYMETRNQKGANQDVNDWGDDNSAVTSQKRISNNSAHDREERPNAAPSIHICRSGRHWLLQWSSQVVNQIWGYPIVSNPFCHFHSCNPKKKSTKATHRSLKPEEQGGTPNPVSFKPKSSVDYGDQLINHKLEIASTI